MLYHLILCLDQIRRHVQEKARHSYTLLMVPRVSTLVKKILEDEGVLGEVSLASYDLQLIPLADDVLSLERDNAFKEIWVVSGLSVFKVFFYSP